MPQVTLLEAAKKSQNKLFQGIALGVVTTDALAAIIPFKTFASQSITYIREGDPPSTAFIPDDGTMGTPSTATSDLVSVPVRRVGSDLDVDSLADDLSRGAEVGYQIAKKSKATWDLVSNKLINGAWSTGYTLASVANPFNAVDAVSVAPWMDSNRYGPGSIKYVHGSTSWAFRAPGDAAYGPAVVATVDGNFVLYSLNKSKYITVTLDVSDATQNGETLIYFSSSTDEFDGIKRLVAPSMILSSIGTDGDDFSFSVLDKLIDAVKVRNNRAFFLPGKLIMKYLALHRSLGGTAPMDLSRFGYTGEVLSYRGIPLLQNDHILSNESKGASSTLASCYLASLDSDEGLFMGVPDANTSSQLVEADPRDTVVLGWRIESLGALELKAHRRTRVQWYGAAGLRSSLALARASEIKTA